VGDRVHLTGADFYDIVPEAERPSTTTTTLPGGGILPTCPDTRPAAAVTVHFHQDGVGSTELARVVGNAIDLDVVIPASAAPGPALLIAGSGLPVPLTVVPGSTVTTRPSELPRTGTATWPTASTALVLLGVGLALTTTTRVRERSR
jgi:hypothetical protein